jgi:hypothetical protein
MRLMLYVILIQAGLLTGLSSALPAQDATILVNKALEAGNAEDLSEHFNSTLDISLPGTDQSMSKSHARQVMKSFFKQHRPKSYKVNHQGSSREATKYIIGTYTCTQRTYKTYILLKKKEEKYLIVQLQFEEE